MSAIYPGSFDPVTKGHINIARRAAVIMGHVTIAVLDNPHKTPLFSALERVGLLRQIFAHDKNITIESFSGLLVDYARQKGIRAIIRGIRNPEDMAKEVPYAIWNRQLSDDILETLYLPADPTLAHVSGSIVKEVAAHLYKGRHDDIVLANMVVPEVRAALKEKYK